MTDAEDKEQREAARRAIAELEASDPAQRAYGDRCRAGYVVCDACGSWHQYGADCSSCGVDAAQPSRGTRAVGLVVLATLLMGSVGPAILDPTATDDAILID